MFVWVSVYSDNWLAMMFIYLSIPKRMPLTFEYIESNVSM